jgi:RNA polymerase sigma-70 factor (ECF subfamily)
METETTSVESLAERLAPALLTYFTRRVPDASDAADLLAETLLVVWRRSPDLPHDPAQARMWTYGIARRVLATHRRGGARRHALAARLRAELELTQAAPHAPNDRESHPYAAVHAAIARLSPLDQEIVRLVHWDGFTLADVSALLGKRPGTIRSRYHRARHRLREDLSSRPEVSAAKG